MDTNLTSAVLSTQVASTKKQMSIAMMKYAAEAQNATALSVMDTAVANGEGYSGVNVPLSSVKGTNVDISI